MRIFKKTVAVACVVATSVSVAGCTNVKDTEVLLTRDETIDIDFSWWGNDDRHIYTMDGVELFENQNPNIRVTDRFGVWSGYERRNQVWMESANAADVMQINYSWLNTYSKDGEGYYNLNELTDIIDLSNYDEEDLKYGMKNGKLNAIPIAFNTATVCFNKELFEEYNLEYPTSWDELFDVAKVASKDDRYVIGMPKKHLFLMLIAYYEQKTGEKFYDENGKLLASRDQIGIIVDFYKDMVDSKVLMPIEDFDRKKFAAGDCLGSVFWVSDADNYCGSLSDNGFTPYLCGLFTMDDAKLSGLYMKPATLYAINANTDHPKEAAKLLNFLVSNEEMALMQGTEKGVPVNKSALKALEDEDMLNSFGYTAFEIMNDNKDKMSVMIEVMEDEKKIDAFKETASAYLYEAASRDEAIDEIYANLKN